MSVLLLEQQTSHSVNLLTTAEKAPSPMGLVVDPYADTFRRDGKNPISVTVNKDRTNAPFKHISPLFSRMSDSNVHALICCTQIANNTSQSTGKYSFP